MTETSARWNKKYYDSDSRPESSIWCVNFGEDMYRFCCSHCDGTTTYKYPYCPWCGAKMDTEEQEWQTQ